MERLETGSGVSLEQMEKRREEDMVSGGYFEQQLLALTESYFLYSRAN